MGLIPEKGATFIRVEILAIQSGLFDAFLAPPLA
jgi:hypothetical protein